MGYLIVSIIFSAGMVLLFKWFELKKIVNLHALLINYLTCSVLCNSFSRKGPIVMTHFWEEEWFPYTLFLGVLFIVVFYATAITAQKIAVTVSIVASKMSVIIPVLFSYFFMKGELNIITIIGIIGSLAAVYFTVKREKTPGISGMHAIIFPLVVFIGSGIVDSSLNFLQDRFMGTSDVNDQLALIFGIAGITGLLVYIYQVIVGQKKKFTWLEVLGGIILGTFNYVCTLTLMKALNIGFLSSTMLFPIYNVGIVTFATMMAILLYRERLSKINWLGIGLSILFIVLISQSDVIYRYIQNN